MSPDLRALLAAVICVFVAVSAAASAQEVEQGTAAVERGDFAEAFKHWLPLAEQGNPIAQTNIGLMYLDGKGAAQDDAEAAKWFLMAAHRGDLHAQLLIAEMYLNGEGVVQSDVEASRWYLAAAAQGSTNETGFAFVKKAAANGDAQAQNFMGAYYAFGESPDYGEAVKWYKRAAVQGIADAQAELGALFELGLGVALDHEKSLFWYEKAAKQGSEFAQSALGLKYSNGEGVALNRQLGLMWLYVAAANATEPDFAQEAAAKVASELHETAILKAKWRVLVCLASDYRFCG